jgi:hypothetical protein
LVFVEGERPALLAFGKHGTDVLPLREVGGARDEDRTVERLSGPLFVLREISSDVRGRLCAVLRECTGADARCQK